MGKSSTIQYILKERANSGMISLNVTLQNGLEVAAPKGISLRSIQKILTDNKDWIEKPLDQVSQRLQLLAPGDINLQAIGKRWEVEYQPASFPLVSTIGEKRNILSVRGNIGHKYEIALALRRWLNGKGHLHLVPWLQELSKEFNLPFGKALVKGQRTRWGSCSSQGTISINRNLLFLPRDLARYVLIHELVHTMQLDHSPKFWKMLLERDPLGKELSAEARKSWCHVPHWAYEH